RRDGRLARKRSSKRHGLLHQIREGKHPVHQSDAMRLGGRDVLARKEQLQCAASADEPRKPLRATIAGYQTEIDFWLADFRRIRGEPERARQGELTSTAQRVTIDRRDHRLAETGDGIEHVLPAKRERTA